MYREKRDALGNTAVGIVDIYDPKGEVVIIILDQPSIIRTRHDKQPQIINKLFMQKCKAFEEKYAASRIPYRRLCT